MKPSRFISQFERELGTSRCSVLDIGCSLGRNSLFLARMGHSVIGIDTNQQEVQEARRNARDREIPCDFILADARALPFRRGSFSVVIINELLHTMSKTEARGVITEAFEVTKPGGLHAVSGYFSGNRKDAACESYLKTGELREIYAEAGWNIRSYVENPTVFEEIDSLVFVYSTASIIAQKQR